MVYRSVYLAVYNRTARSRAHFAIFIPNLAANSTDLSVENDLAEVKGTVIHVVGEPVMQGYVLEFKRNYDCKSSQQLQKLVPLGYVDGTNVANPSSTEFSRDNIPKSTVERVAAQVPPPPRGQNVRAPIDGVTTKRCQEWTTEYVQKLADQNLISPSAPNKVQEERDPPTHGIFGYKN